MVASIHQILILLLKTKKIWIIPIILTLVIIAIIIISAQVSPVPVFLYPLI
ncbi:MAG: DUF5989 family protein [Candidatus Marinimicrobia bacterium]|nr:DUF5989 family protein [Candidatus Neomarinimicrobiota bacterium]